MNLRDMGDNELKVHIGNAAYVLWTRLPEPKPDYIEWYYGMRIQSLSEALEGHRLIQTEGGTDATP